MSIDMHRHLEQGSVASPSDAMLEQVHTGIPALDGLVAAFWRTGDLAYEPQIDEMIAELVTVPYSSDYANFIEHRRDTVDLRQSLYNRIAPVVDHFLSIDRVSGAAECIVGLAARRFTTTIPCPSGMGPATASARLMGGRSEAWMCGVYEALPVAEAAASYFVLGQGELEAVGVIPAADGLPVREYLTALPHETLVHMGNLAALASPPIDEYRRRHLA